MAGIQESHSQVIDEPVETGASDVACQNPAETEIALRERIKELTCLYRLGKMIENCGSSTEALDVLFQGVVDILPESWLYPEITCARIVFGKNEYTTDSFGESPWTLDANIQADGAVVGVMEVIYLERRPPLDEGPFMNEERSLIDAIAERLGKVIERIVAQQQLVVKRLALEQKNVALRELIVGIREEKEDASRSILANVDKVIMPTLNALETGLSSRQREYVAMVKHDLQEITSPFTAQLMSRFASLTPKEIRICNHIRSSLSSKQIAATEHISPATIRTYRFQIRRKLGLLNKGINLTSFLQAMMTDQSK